MSDLFHETLPPPPGLAVRTPDSCKCGTNTATIGAGAGPHIASLHCVDCGAHRGWLSHEVCSFVNEAIQLFGRPTTPIAIRRGRSGE
jgi:hypothetical protein